MSTPRPSHFLYLHGFRSSPQSAKAQQVLSWLHRHHPQLEVWCPQLPPSPALAMALVASKIEVWQAELADRDLTITDRLVVMGSSLGGFYATHVARFTGCRSVLLNPAIAPARDLAAYIGEQRQWHSDEAFFFEPHFVDELLQLTHSDSPEPHRLMPIIATGDEVLDWREMVGRYPGSPLRLIQGGDHALSDFEAHLPAALAFLGLATWAHARAN